VPPPDAVTEPLVENVIVELASAGSIAFASALGTFKLPTGRGRPVTIAQVTAVT
jgi:hypothetical protein